MNRYLWLSAGLLVGIGCRSTTEPFANVQVVTTIGPRSDLASPVIITTTVSNRANRAITLETSGCPSRFRVETMAGARIGPRGRVCTLQAMLVTLAPGQQLDLTEQWDGTDSTGARVSGTFRVIGQPFSDQGPQSAPVTVQLPE